MCLFIYVFIYMHSQENSCTCSCFLMFIWFEHSASRTVSAMCETLSTVWEHCEHSVSARCNDGIIWNRAEGPSDIHHMTRQCRIALSVTNSAGCSLHQGVTRRWRPCLFRYAHTAIQGRRDRSSLVRPSPRQLFAPLTGNT